MVRTCTSHHPTRRAARESLAEEADDALRDFLQTGLHVTHHEVDSWVESLGTRRPGRLPPVRG